MQPAAASCAQQMITAFCSWRRANPKHKLFLLIVTLPCQLRWGAKSASTKGGQRALYTQQTYMAARSGYPIAFASVSEPNKQGKPCLCGSDHDHAPRSVSSNSLGTAKQATSRLALTRSAAKNTKYALQVSMKMRLASHRLPAFLCCPDITSLRQYESRQTATEHEYPGSPTAISLANSNTFQK
jgi:hypothetical protein